LLVYVLRVYALIMLAAVVWGIAASLFWTAGSTQVLDSSDRAQYGIRAGVLNLSAKIGITLGVAVLGAILERHGYGGLFSVALAIGSVGVLTAFLIPNSPHRAGWPQWRGLGDFYVRRRGIIMAAVFVVPGLAYGHMLGLINLYIIDTVGEAYVGRITSTFLASGVLFSLIGGQASDRFGRRLPLVISFLLGAGGLLSMSYPTNPWILACGAFLLGVQFGTVPTVILAWVGDHVPPGERALGHASIFAWRDLGIGVSILLGGSFTQWGWPYRSVFLLSASIFLMAALVSWAFVTEAAGTARR
jgi:predicted MFS family arabinose efflux permease